MQTIVATEARERIGRSALSFAAGLRIFRSRGSYERFPGGRSGAILDGWRRARARRSSDAYRSSRSSGARSTRHGREEARPSSSPEKRASARPGSQPSLRHAPATRGSTSDSGARSTSSARTCRTSRSWRPCARSQTSVRSTGGRRARSCACSRRHWPCSRITRPRHLCCSCSRTCTGPTRRRSTSWSFSRTTSPTGRFSCSGHTARTSSRRRSACAALPTESGARARRSCSTWRPLAPEELSALLAAHTQAPTPAALSDAIIDRSEGNPFFAEELLAAADGQSDELPRGLRDLLLQRVARLDRPTQSLLRLAAAAGRDVGYPLLLALAALPEPPSGSRCAWRSSTASSSPYRRPAASDSATHSWRRRSTRRFFPASARSCTRSWPKSSRAAEPCRRQSSRRTGRRRVAAAEALVASVEAARQAEEVFGLAEALAHVERALALWPEVPDAAELVQVDLAELCSWAAKLASQTGAAPRAVELAQRAIALVEKGDALRAARFYDRLGRYLHESGRTDAALSAFERVVELVPATAALGRARAGSGGARARVDARLALRRVAHDLRAGARARARDGPERGRAPGAAGSRQGPRVPRPRRRGSRVSRAGSRARRGERRSHSASPGVHLTHRRADDAGTAAGVGTGREERPRGRSPLRDRQHGARRERHRGHARDWRVGRGRQRDRGGAPLHHRQFSLHAPHDARRHRARARRLRGRAGASRGRASDVARGSRAGDLRRLPRRAGPVGAALDGSRPGGARRPGAGELPAGRSAARLVLCEGTTCTCRAGSPRSRPQGCGRRPCVARAGREAHRRRSTRRGGGLSGHAEHGRLARPGRGGVRACARGRAAGAVVRGGGDMAPARAPAHRGLLPLARGRGARRRRRVTRRGERAPRRRARRRDPDRGKASAARARAACRAGAARSHVAGRRVPRQRAGPERGPRSDETRGGGPHTRLPWLHQPRDRPDARHQRQDRERPRLAHPAQARRARTGSKRPQSHTASPHRTPGSDDARADEDPRQAPTLGTGRLPYSAESGRA